VSKNNSDNEYNAVRRRASAKNTPTTMAIKIAKNPPISHRFFNNSWRFLSSNGKENNNRLTATIWYNPTRSDGKSRIDKPTLGCRAKPPPKITIVNSQNRTSLMYFFAIF